MRRNWRKTFGNLPGRGLYISRRRDHRPLSAMRSGTRVVHHDPRSRRCTGKLRMRRNWRKTFGNLGTRVVHHDPRSRRVSFGNTLRDTGKLRMRRNWRKTFGNACRDAGSVVTIAPFTGRGEAANAEELEKNLRKCAPGRGLYISRRRDHCPLSAMRSGTRVAHHDPRSRRVSFGNTLRDTGKATNAEGFTSQGVVTVAPFSNSRTSRPSQRAPGYALGGCLSATRSGIRGSCECGGTGENLRKPGTRALHLKAS